MYKPFVMIDGYRQELEGTIFSEEIAAEDELNPGQVLDEMLYYLVTDTDSDVRYFVSEFVPQDKLDLYLKRRQVEDLEIQKKQEQEPLPPPPPPPAHLIMNNVIKEEEENSPMDVDESKADEAITTDS